MTIWKKILNTTKLIWKTSAVKTALAAAKNAVKKNAANAVVAAAAKFNEVAATEGTDEFGRTIKVAQSEEGPYYAMQMHIRYYASLGGLHAGADAISGDFSLQSSGFKIENGKKTDYIKSFTVAGNFYEMLKNIVAMANNCHLPRAMGSTAFGAPSVLVDGLSVAGK